MPAGPRSRFWERARRFVKFRSGNSSRLRQRARGYSAEGETIRASNVAAPTAPAGQRAIHRRITRAYLLGLGVIALTSTLAFAIPQLLVSTQEQSAHLINLSGRQRMLSQRIGLLATEYAGAADAARAEAKRGALTASLTEFREAYHKLTQGDPLRGRGLDRELSPAMREIYAGARDPLNAYMARFLGEVDAVLAREPGTARTLELAQALSSLAETRLLARLNDVVAQYEREAKAQVRMVQRLELIVYLATLGVLLASAAFIFRPMAREVTGRTQALEEAHEEASHSATHDELTGLPNRRYLREFAIDWLHRAMPAPTGAVLQLDLDGFKRVNDRYGHAVGDELLKAVARRLNHEIRAGDFVARVGGDEFVVVLTGLKAPQDHAIVAQRLVDTIAEPVLLSVGLVRIGISVGVALSADSPASFERLLQHADVSLYEAKRSGKNRWQLYHPGLETASALAQGARRAG